MPKVQRDLAQEPGHRASHVHQSEPLNRPDHQLSHRQPALRRSLERGHHGVPDEPGAVPAHSLHAYVLRSGHLCREGLPRTAVRGRDHDVRLRAGVHDGQVPASLLLHEGFRTSGRRISAYNG